ncbi:MAG: hypothetical protein LC768_02695 [Acidobacteria bacterium]|nr:hypothetical protein [Acidobacteriota bacterium]MCA1637241.1 hypothetical protein [Acidobacteriota bacterium]
MTITDPELNVIAALVPASSRISCTGVDLVTISKNNFSKRALTNSADNCSFKFRESI